MYYFTFKSTNLHKIDQKNAFITNFYIQLDDFSPKKLHYRSIISLFFTFFRVKIIDKATINPNAQG